MQIESNLLCGDCLELLRDVPDHSVDLVVTDPPYLITTAGGGLNRDPGRKIWDNLKPLENGFNTAVLDEVCRVMKKINIYIFCSLKQVPILLDYFVKGKGCNFNIICWHKTDPTPACGNKYLSDTEYIMFFREKGVRVGGNYHTKRTFYVTPSNRAESKKYEHPTVKPLNIVKNLILNSSAEGDIVLDPFMGTGTTCVAAASLGRRYFGIELDEIYYRIAQQRISEEKQSAIMIIPPETSTAV